MVINETIESQIVIGRGADEIWDALVNPEKIKQYMFGARAISLWELGAELVFQGEYQGKSYQDKGVIRNIDPGRILQYTYLSSFSGVPDLPENYSLVTFTIELNGGGNLLKVSQKGFLSVESRDHSEQNWSHILNSIKKVVESG